MTTESGSDSESKDKEQDQEENPAQEGTAESQPQEQQPQQPSEEQQTALEQFSAVAAHSTPVRKEQVRQPTDTRPLHATGWAPTYCCQEIASLARVQCKYIFRYAWKGVQWDAVDLGWFVFRV